MCRWSGALSHKSYGLHSQSLHGLFATKRHVWLNLIEISKKGEDLFAQCPWPASLYVLFCNMVSAVIKKFHMAKQHSAMFKQFIRLYTWELVMSAGCSCSFLQCHKEEQKSFDIVGPLPLKSWGVCPVTMHWALTWLISLPGLWFKKIILDLLVKKRSTAPQLPRSYASSHMPATLYFHQAVPWSFMLGSRSSPKIFIPLMTWLETLQALSLQHILRWSYHLI